MTEKPFQADPPYHAVIFTSLRSSDDGGYAEADARMLELARQQPGFLGVESVRDGLGITISYWRDEAAIAAWRRDLDHGEAQAQGRARWYERYQVQVARVERSYGFARIARDPAEA